MKPARWVVFLLAAVLAQSDFNKVGTAGVLFLNIPAGAAAQGLGKAYSGLARGAEAALWNPALLGFERAWQAYSGYTAWLMGLHHQTAAVSFRAGRLGLGFSQVLLTTEALPVTTTRRPQGTGEYFSYLDLALGVSAARAFSDRFALGMTLKYIRESVYGISAQGLALDIGSCYRLGYRDMSLFMVLRNFGPDLGFGGSFVDTRIKGNRREEVTLPYGEFSLPVSFNLGIAATFWQRGTQSLVVAAEAAHPADYGPRLHLGADYQAGKYLNLRGGYKLNYEQESWSLGSGFRSGRFRLDWAYAAMRDFRGIFSWSLNYLIK